jgi:hypothetical protein
MAIALAMTIMYMQKGSERSIMCVVNFLAVIANALSLCQNGTLHKSMDDRMTVIFYQGGRDAPYAKLYEKGKGFENGTAPQVQYRNVQTNRAYIRR